MTDIESIKRKICSCLALSGSPNENEALFREGLTDGRNHLTSKISEAT